MDFTAEFHGLIQHSYGTLTENERREVLEFIEAQDFNLALEALCGFLIDQSRPVTPEFYLRIRTLGERLEGVDPYMFESVKSFVIAE